jgi:hypothetical protein
MTHDSAIRAPLRGWPGTGCPGELLRLEDGLLWCRLCGGAVVVDHDGDVVGVSPSPSAARVAAARLLNWGAIVPVGGQT